jgi:hypothetical protein
VIRYILKRSTRDEYSGCEMVTYHVIDGDAAEVERRMLSGGRGPMGYDVTTLVGVEIIEQEPTP